MIHLEEEAAEEEDAVAIEIETINKKGEIDPMILEIEEEEVALEAKEEDAVEEEAVEVEVE
jgi:hypothetical protein